MAKWVTSISHNTMFSGENSQIGNEILFCPDVFAGHFQKTILSSVLFIVHFNSYILYHAFLIYKFLDFNTPDFFYIQILNITAQDDMSNFVVGLSSKSPRD